MPRRVEPGASLDPGVGLPPPGPELLETVKSAFAFFGDKYTHWCTREKVNRSWLARVLKGQTVGTEARKAMKLVLADSRAREFVTTRVSARADVTAPGGAS